MSDQEASATGHRGMRLVAVASIVLAACLALGLVVQLVVTGESTTWAWGLTVVLLALPIATFARELRRDTVVIDDANQLLRSVVDSSLVGMLVIGVEGDTVGRVVAANPAARDLLGDDAIGRSWTELLFPADRGQAERTLERLAAAADDDPAATSWRGELRHLQPDGSLVQTMVVASMTTTPVCGRVIGLQVLDVHDRKHAEQELKRLALHDPLTGLPNRTLMSEYIAHALSARERSGGEVALIYCDCDEFQQINETFGHAVGDRVLADLGRRLHHAVRLSDAVARMPGDEFVVLCTDLDSAAEAEIVAERLLKAGARPYDLDDGTVPLNVSIGIAVAQPDSDPESLLREANTAMYLAKHDGRGLIRAYEPGLEVEATRRVTVGSELRRALSDGQLRVYYQPILSIADRRVVAVEALVRWQHPDLGLLAAGSFLDIAEESDLVCEIDAWVAGQATSAAAGWPQQRGADIDLHLNLSARHLGNHDAADLVANCLRESGLTAGRLVVELTESTLLSGDRSDGRHDVDQLRESGVRFAADDFGTGFTTLDQLVNLPLDIVKVDRAFTARLESDPRARAIVQAVASLGRSLELSVVAEGVERVEQHALLEDLGIAAYQGFLHAPPVDAETLRRMLAAAN